MNATQSIFDLDPSRWELWLLFLMPALINCLIFLYVGLQLHKNRLNYLFLFFVLSLFVWQCAEGLVRMSVSVEVAHIWHRLSEVGILFVILFGLKFFVYLSKRQELLKNNILSFLLYFPVIFFLVFTLVGEIKYNIIPSPIWYWVTNPILNTVTYALFIWTSIGGLLMLALLVSYYRRSKNDQVKRQQAKLMLIGISLPVFFGIITEVIFPVVLHLNDIPVTAFVVTSLSFFSVLAIKKYHLLDYSPKNQWEGIVEQMNEGILIVNNKGEIMYANSASCEMVGYELDELKGKVVRNILLDAESTPILANAIEQHTKNGTHQFEIRVKTKSGRKIWLEVKSAPYFNSKGEIIGSIGIQTNINDRKKNEVALKHSELRLKQAQSVAKVGNWELNFRTGKAIWSDEACRIYGISENEKYNQSYETWLSYIHPDDLANVKAETEKARLNLSNSSFKHHITHRDGSVRYIHSVAQFEFNSSGTPIGLFGVCYDITEKKNTEHALKESEAQIKTFMNESLLSIYFIDPITKEILYFNNALCKLLGYKPDELNKIQIYDFIDHAKTNVDDRIEETMRIGKINAGERTWRTKSGELINVFVSSFYHEQNGVKTIYVAAQDITDNVRQKKQIEFDQRNLDSLINSTNDLMWSIDKDIKLITVNNSFVSMIKAITGIELKPGDSPLLEGGFPKQILKKWEGFYLRALSGEKFTIEEYTDVPAETYSEISLYPIIEGDQVIGVSCYSRDITKSKLDERERKLITDDLIQRNKDLEQFSYIISHNLRSPVATILGLSALIQTKGQPVKVKNKCVEGLGLSAKKLDETILDLNNILQVRGEINQRKKFVELTNIVEDVKFSIQNLIEREKAVIKIDFSQIEEVFTIKSYMYSIFYNLILNSIKYRKQEEAPVIEIKSLNQNGIISLIFKDNCIGIDMNQYGEKIFGLYKRFHLGVEGKGMGLYMVKTQVEALGGKINLKSEVNKGTEIVVEFRAA